MNVFLLILTLFRLNAVEFQYLFSQTYNRNKCNYLDYLLLVFFYIISKQLPQNLLNSQINYLQSY